MKNIYLTFALIFVSVAVGFSQINFDESLVSDYKLPDILISKNEGK